MLPKNEKQIREDMKNHTGKKGAEGDLKTSGKAIAALIRFRNLELPPASDQADDQHVLPPSAREGPSRAPPPLGLNGGEHSSAERRQGRPVEQHRRLGCV
jgi:hypothetical protein